MQRQIVSLQAKNHHDDAVHNDHLRYIVRAALACCLSLQMV